MSSYNSNSFPAILGGAPAFPGGLKLMRPYVPPLEEMQPFLSQIRETGVVSNFGPFARRFETALAERLQVRHCLTLANLSSGLMYMPVAARLEGGEVIMPSFTFMATAHSMKLGGLTPVFVDIDPETLTLDPRSVEAAITPRSVAVIGVHTYGTPCDINALEEICSRHRLTLFFDSAHGLGSSYAGKPLGGFGLAEGFSTSATKVLTTMGEGGFICTDDDQFADRVRMARNWGHNGDYNARFASIVSKMPEFAAAAGLLELARLDVYLQNRRTYVARLKELLVAVEGIRFPIVRAGDESGFKDLAILISSEQFGMDRDTLVTALTSEGIETRRYFHPVLHKMDAYMACDGSKRVPLPNTQKASREVICLPLHNEMDDSILVRLADAIARIKNNAHAISACKPN
jgi:dTDP-4-amino-4,6-dideoxygalactose transaminase